MPLWKHQLSTLRQTGLEEILISGRNDPLWRPGEFDFVADAQPVCGPLGGLAAALDAMRGSHLLALAIDMPFMSADYLRSLAAAITGPSGMVPVLEGRPEPLAAIYPREAAPIARELIRARSDVSLRGFIENLLRAGLVKERIVLPNESPLFQNINEPRDIAESLTR